MWKVSFLSLCTALIVLWVIAVIFILASNASVKEVNASIPEPEKQYVDSGGEFAHGLTMYKLIDNEPTQGQVRCYVVKSRFSVNTVRPFCVYIPGEK